MNNAFFSLFLLMLLNSKANYAQEAEPIVDSATAAKLTISGFCLCKTTIADLKVLSDDFKEVDVEEMDLPKKCYGSDSRYTDSRGYYSEKYKGMIFQKGDVSEYIGKIRLTKDFRGILPNGSFVDLQVLTLRDVFVMYPELKETWHSRDCSEYWNFSDKTISFYVRINKEIQPQFPINESDYLDKQIEGIDLVASCYSFVEAPSEPLQLFRPNEPMYFVDSIRTNESFIRKEYDPSEFAAVRVVKGENAIKIGGQEGRNGVIYIYTKNYAREKYFNAFRTKSKEYNKSVTSPDQFDVVYILNGKVLKENYEIDLFEAAADPSLEIEIIDRNQLRHKFGKKGKIGVLLKTRK